jgi:capsular polysaccharide biosynthesis protein
MPHPLRAVRFSEAAETVPFPPEPAARLGRHTQTTLRPAGRLDLRAPLLLPEDHADLPERITPAAPPLLLARLEGAIFDPGSGVIAPTPETVLFEPDTMWPVRVNHIELGGANSSGRGAATDWPFEPSRARPLDGAYVVLGLIRSDYLSTWYHWLIEHLPRLHLLSDFSSLRNLPVLTAAPTTEAQRESLAALGLTPRRIVALPAEGGPVRPEVGYLPAPIGVHSSVSPEATGWLAETVLDRLGLRNIKAEALIYVRRRIPPRAVANDDELSSHLAAAGFDIVASETLGFAQQVQRYRRARVVVSAHGAGLANTVFCRPGTVVVELTSLAHGARPSLNMIYANLSASRGLVHVFCVGGQADATGRFTVDPAKAMRAAIHGLSAAQAG